jgi:hypothetical protein
MSNIVTVQSQLTQEVATWMAAVNTAGGGFEWNSVAIANNFIRVLRTKNYYGKIKYLLPLLGKGIGAARVPLINSISSSSATNTSFVDADFNQSTGLTGNGAGKRFDLGFTGSSLGSGGDGALGYWALSIGSNPHVMGERNGDLFCLIFSSAADEAFYWGSGGPVQNIVAPTVSHYYGQRTSSALTIYRSGAQVAINSMTSGVTNLNNTNMFFMGIDASFTTNGRSGLGYLTDGTMTSNEISDFHAVLSAYLMGPTGRI